MSYGARYLNHLNAATLCRMGRHMAEAGECRHQAPVFAQQAAHHEAQAALLRQQLLAARKLGLRGSAGQLPKGYMSDAPAAQSAIGNPQS